MSSLTVATWNVNSVRSRMHVLLPWLKAVSPDVVCLQETKVQDHEFPQEPIEALGYCIAFRGQKSYNGVAILSKTSIEDVLYGLVDDGPADEARLIAGRIRGITVVNAYVPQGRDPEHEMFGYKLEWFRRLRAHLGRLFTPGQPLVLVGDLNVAPTEIDVWDPKGLLGHVCFRPEVTEALENLASWGLVDIFRKHVPDPLQFTYYDYRTRDGVNEGKGWRIDHILATEPLAARSRKAWIDLDPRRVERPSDHAPLLALFEDQAEIRRVPRSPAG